MPGNHDEGPASLRLRGTEGELILHRGRQGELGVRPAKSSGPPSSEAGDLGISVVGVATVQRVNARALRSTWRRGAA